MLVMSLHSPDVAILATSCASAMNSQSLDYPPAWGIASSQRIHAGYCYKRRDMSLSVRVFV